MHTADIFIKTFYKYIRNFQTLNKHFAWCKVTKWQALYAFCLVILFGSCGQEGCKKAHKGLSALIMKKKNLS